MPGRPARARLVRREIRRRADDREPTVRAGRHRVRPRRHVERPGSSRRQVAGGQPSASASRITSSLLSSLRSMFRWRGDLVECGEDLERDVALDEPRDVDMAALPRAEEVAAPQQRVGVQVGDPQPFVEGAGPIRRDGTAGGRAAHRRASVRPTIARPPALAPSVAAARQRADHRRPRRQRRSAAVIAGTCRSMRRPDLVEERQRAGVALERGPDEVAQRGLGLALDAGRQAERGDRLDVEALVGLEQLERLEREAGAIVGRARDSARTGCRRAAGPSGTARRPRGPGRIRRSGRPPAAGRVRRGGASRTSAPPGPVPSRRRAVRTPAGAACRAVRRRGAPRATGRRVPPGTRPSRPIRASRAG